MSVQMTIILVGAALATVLVYLVASRVLPGRWRKSEVEASEDFTLDSVNVLIARYLVAVLNHPFSGVYRVEPSAFQILISRLNASP
jgi:hypothetical protein